MQEFSGTYPGTAGTVVISATMPTVHMLGYCVKWGLLSCATQQLQLQFISETGTIYNDFPLQGSGFFWTGTRADSISGGDEISQINLIQRFNGSAGVPFQLKICLTVSDFPGRNSCICTATCASVYSYVDIW